MALTAPLSKFKRNNFIYGIILCAAFAVWFAYDGYFNDKFITKHTKDGVAESDLVFNRKAPFVLFPIAALLGGYLLLISKKQIVADETALVIDGKVKIAYDSIEKIDKTNFDAKGHFTITYKDASGKETDFKISDRAYDNLGPILDHLVAKIS